MTMRGGNSPNSMYRWTCPFCGKSRTNVAIESEDGKNNAITALQTHITALGGDGHGPQHEVPSGLEEEWFANHVEEVDGRGK